MHKSGWFDENMNPKPIFYAFRNLTTKWSTHSRLVTNANGLAMFDAYGGENDINIHDKGNYDITVTYGNITATAMIHVSEKTTQQITIVLPVSVSLTSGSVPSITTATTGEENQSVGAAIFPFIAVYLLILFNF